MVRLFPDLQRRLEGLRIKISCPDKRRGSIRRYVRFWLNRIKRMLGVPLSDLDLNFFVQGLGLHLRTGHVTKFYDTELPLPLI